MEGPLVGVLLVACTLDSPLIIALRSDAQGSLKAAFLLCPAEMFVPSSKYCQKNTQRAVSCFTELRSARNSAGGAERLCQVDLLENLR